NSSIALGGANTITFTGRGILSSPGAGDIKLGAPDNSTVVAQFLLTQNGSGSNIAGQNWTIIGSLSTGTATDGDIIIQTGVKNGVSGSGAATATTAITIKGETQNVQLNGITTDATHTDSTVCQDTTTHGLYFGSGTAGICLGTSSKSSKVPGSIVPIAASL